MAKSKIVKLNEKIAEGVVRGYQKIEDGVVSGYKKIENGAVGGFQKIADKFVEDYLTKENETVEEAHMRLAAEQKAREEAGARERIRRAQEQMAGTESNERGGN